jgi:hypothetical protein
MKIHEVTLIFMRAPTEAKVDKFYGLCNDGTLAIIAGIGQIHFHREADSLENALRSALKDARAAGFTVKRVEMAPDAVLLST